MGRNFENRKASIFKTAGQKSKLYSKYGKQLYVVAKNGVPDPDANPALRAFIEKAKRDQVPAHVIDKAIEKAKGVGGEDFVSARYEGFGPGNCMAVSVRWLNTGEIVIRRNTSGGTQATTQGPVVGRITSDHALFYPVCAAWGLLGMAMFVLAPLGYFSQNELLLRLAAYTCVSLLPLGFGTVLVAWLAT